MAKITDFHFPSVAEGHNIHCRMWSPVSEPVGVVQIVHGVAEHIGRYNDFAEFLAEHGYVAVGDDHLGHGLTINEDSEKCWFDETDGWKKIVQDEKTLRDRIRERFPELPLILLGHSMGSFMARTYIGWYPDDFDACILSGTGHTPGAVCRAGRMLARREIRRHGSKFRSPLLQNMAFGRYLKGIEKPIGQNDWICRDEAVIRAYDADPLCGTPGTAELMNEMMLGLEEIGNNSHIMKMKKDLPVLFIAGEADPVGNWGKGVRTVFDRFKSIGMQDVTIKMYPGARHEVLNELNKEEVWNDVLNWLEQKRT